MTKNEECLTVTVLDVNGNIIGKTYPKRAKGLVKKCRAQYVSDFEIRLETTDPTCENTEELKMDIIETTIVTEETPKKNYIFFNPKKWQKHPDVESTVADRFFINGIFDDKLTEVYSLGSWGYDWSEITGGMMTLEKNTEYHFVFWLNGGENDNNNEVCQLHIMFGNNSLGINVSEWNEKLVYKLNRSFLKPLHSYNGWELYDIPFVTTDKDYTQIRFVAQRAPMTIMTAEEPEKYSELTDTVDEFADRRPQRHNIVFEDGWPTNTWYATSKLKGGNASASNQSSYFANHTPQIAGSHNTFIVDGAPLEDMADEILSSLTAMLETMKEEILGEIGK